MTQISELKNRLKMFGGDTGSHDLRFITVTFAEFNCCSDLIRVIGYQ